MTPERKRELREKARKMDADMDRVTRAIYCEMRRKARERWVKACEWDRIDPKGIFVVFSADNPFRP